MLKLIAEPEEDSDEGFRTTHKLFIDPSTIHMHSTLSRFWAMTIATRATIVTMTIATRATIVTMSIETRATIVTVK
jgi:hypothetical protein